jgi:cytochrome b subunit of formate dehydrogenase
LAVLKGSPEAANCTSCHGVHAIVEQSSPQSTVHANNLERTCGACHENISKEFINIPVHPIDLQNRNPVAFYAKHIYIWLIILTIGGMFVHNLIILVYHIRQKQNTIKNELTHQRFQPFEVYQHGLLILSFFILVVTGFALKFPDALWVRWLVSLGMSEEIRSLLHRIAAVILIIISLIQIVYFISFRKGRKEIRSLKPKVGDFVGFWQNMKFYLGISKNRPKFGRWDYTEKAEYLALIWGTAIMTITGLILWFPEFFMDFLPAWMFEVSEIIHYYEAWLATLAILIWHWFFVIYHPEKYPMSLTWMNGKITDKEMRHHHPLEYDELNKNK